MRSAVRELLPISRSQPCLELPLNRLLFATPLRLKKARKQSRIFRSLPPPSKERRPLWISSVPIVGCEAKLLERTEWNHANMLQMLRFLDVPNLAATTSWLKVLHFWGLLRENSIWSTIPST